MSNLNELMRYCLFGDKGRSNVDRIGLSVGECEIISVAGSAYYAYNATFAHRNVCFLPPPSSPPSTTHKVYCKKMSSLDFLKASGTVVVSDSGDFECKSQHCSPKKQINLFKPSCSNRCVQTASMHFSCDVAIDVY